MPESTRVAGRPPLGSLWRLAGAGLAIWLPVAACYATATSPDGFRDRDTGSVSGFKIGILVTLAPLALWGAVVLVRTLQRWLLLGAGIVAEGDTVRFRVPIRRAWWHPWLRVEAWEWPIAAIKGISFDTSSACTLTVVADGKPRRIPPGAFAAGGYTIDARLRALTGTTLDAVEPQRFWQASTAGRIGIVGTGVALLFGIVLLVGLLGRGDARAMKRLTKLAAPVVVLPFGLFALALIHRGRLVIDPRGLFHERGGKVAHLPWGAIRAGDAQLTRSFGVIFRSLDIRAATTFTRGALARIALTQIIGLGFPLGTVVTEIESACRHWR